MKAEREQDVQSRNARSEQQSVFLENERPHLSGERSPSKQDDGRASESPGESGDLKEIGIDSVLRELSTGELPEQRINFHKKGETNDVSKAGGVSSSAGGLADRGQTRTRSSDAASGALEVGNLEDASSLDEDGRLGGEHDPGYMDAHAPSTGALSNDLGASNAFKTRATSASSALQAKRYKPKSPSDVDGYHWASSTQGDTEGDEDGADISRTEDELVSMQTWVMGIDRRTPR